VKISATLASYLIINIHFCNFSTILSLSLPDSSPFVLSNQTVSPVEAYARMSMIELPTKANYYGVGLGSFASWLDLESAQMLLVLTQVGATTQRHAKFNVLSGTTLHVLLLVPLVLLSILNTLSTP
jgi:hypothetical protein